MESSLLLKDQNLTTDSPCSSGRSLLAILKRKSSPLEVVI